MSKRKRTKPRGKHREAGKELERCLGRFENVNEIKKIILGTAVPSRHRGSPGEIKFKNYTTSGLQYDIYTENGIREIFLICRGRNKKRVKEKIDKLSN